MNRTRVNETQIRNETDSNSTSNSNSTELTLSLLDTHLPEELINLTTRFHLGTTTHKSYFAKRHQAIMSRIGKMTKKIFGGFFSG